MKRGQSSSYTPQIWDDPEPRRRGVKAILYRLGHVWRNIADQPIRAISIIAAVAVGVSIAIAIIAASDGIEAKVNALLNVGGTIDHAHQAAYLKAAGVDFDSIHQVLMQTRRLLTVLAIGFTAALVAIVTFVTTRQRRREIGIKRMNGENISGLLVELLMEALILCFIGGITGIGLGRLLCYIISLQVPLLPMSPSMNGVLLIFPWATLLSFLATFFIVAFYAMKIDTSVSV